MVPTAPGLPFVRPRVLLTAALLANLGCGGSGGDGGDDKGGTESGEGTEGESSDAGDGDGDSDGFWCSGTRLTPYLYVAEDGAEELAGWWDGELGVECEWTTATDGRERCLPGNRRASQYADPECTQPLWRVECGDPPEFLQEQIDGQGIAVSRLGELHAGAVYGNSPDDCIEKDPPPGGDYYLPGDLVEAEGFVGSERVMDDGNDRILGFHRVADDGACQKLKLEVEEGDPAPWDTDLEVLVNGALHLDEELRWLPILGASIGFWYADDACSVPVGVESSTKDPGPFAAGQIDIDACERPYDVRPIDGPHAADIYSEGGPACELEEADPDRDYYALGDSSAGSTFADAPLVTVGGSRLERTFYANASQLPLMRRDRDWRDTNFDLECRFRSDADGELRCLPQRFQTGVEAIANWYEDPECTVSLLRFDSSDCDQLSPVLGLLEEELGEGCSEEKRYHYFDVTELFPGPDVYRFVSDTCELDSIDPGTEFWRLGEELDPEDFVAVSRELAD